jgi:uncharacterized delta-60 repeat protein
LRYTNAGLPDTSFGGGSGVVQTSFHVEDGRSLGDLFRAVAIDSMNRIVAVGSMEYCLVAGDLSTAQYWVVLARYDANGNTDTSFGLGGSGRVWAPQGTVGKDTAKSIAVQSDGRIIIVGDSQPLVAGVLWRFNADGTVDSDFGNGGWVTDPIANGAVEARLTGIALGPDGRIVCGGFVATAGSPLIHYTVLARFWQ